MAAVEFLGVDKTYPDGTRALRDLNLAVADGEMLVLVGPSGCGKSTALRLLAGLDPVTAGEIRVGGQRVDGRSPQRRDVAMVFQNYALYPHMTVRRNLEFPLRMMRLARAEIRSRVAETAALLGLNELLERRPRQLSGGQRQRVAMGRAMVRQPQVFLMDEPLSNLDARLRTQIRAEIAKLQRRLGTTTLYVTHDQVEAMTLGDRIAVLNAGRLQQVGPAQELYDRPANAFVAAFLGNPGMNLIAATVNGDGGTLQLGGYGWRIPFERLPAGPRARTERGGEPLLLGLRPEAFSPRSILNAEVQVDSVEPLGHERLVYFRPLATPPDPGPSPLVARLVGPPAEAPGQIVELGLDPQRLHFFTARGDAIA